MSTEQESAAVPVWRWTYEDGISVRCEACGHIVSAAFLFGLAATGAFIETALCQECAHAMVATVAQHEQRQTDEVTITLTWAATDDLSVTEVLVEQPTEGVFAEIDEQAILLVASVRLRRYIDGYLEAAKAEQAEAMT